VTALADLIRAEIDATGPMSTARFMDLALGHPVHGYYATRDPLGAAGDFTTAPEISQMFGEMIGVWVAGAWAALGRPGVRLVELGPGRGTLMADVLRVLARAGAAPEVWLVETSPVLRTAQAARVPGAHWAERLEDVPAGPLILLANEFLDALPVHQFLQSPEGWRARQVGLDDGRLIWGLSGPVPLQAREAGWAERSPAADGVLAEIRRRLDAGPGAALIVDYGYDAADRPAGPTLQALSGHAPADPLAAPGEADLTWLLDFDHVAAALGPGTVCMAQGTFLAGLGIGARAEALARAAPGRADEIADQLERLTSPDRMGTLFKTAARIAPAPPETV